MSGPYDKIQNSDTRHLQEMEATPLEANNFGVKRVNKAFDRNFSHTHTQVYNPKMLCTQKKTPLLPSAVIILTQGGLGVSGGILQHYCTWYCVVRITHNSEILLLDAGKANTSRVESSTKATGPCHVL